MELYIRENGLLTLKLKMVEESKYGQMVDDMMGIGSKIKFKDMGVLFMQKVMCTKVNG